MANTVTFTAQDGKRESFSLAWLVEQGAVLARTLNGASVADTLGAANQLWIPGASGNHFLRDIVDIAFEERPEAEVPAPPCLDERGLRCPNRPNCAARLSDDVGLGGLHVVGEELCFEGYADDFDRAITAVEFSLDGGATWDVRPVEGAVAGPWTYWYYRWTPTEPGWHELWVRAVNEEGAHSPTPACVRFSVM